MIKFNAISFRDLINGLGDYISDIPVYFTPEDKLNPENYVYFVFMGKEEADAIRHGVYDAEIQYDNSDVGLHFPNITIDYYYELEKMRNPVAQRINMENLQNNRIMNDMEKHLWFALFCVLHEIGHWHHFKMSGLSAIDYEKSIHAITEVYENYANMIYKMSNINPLKIICAEQYHRESHEKIPSEKAADEYALEHFDEALSLVRKALGYDEEWLLFHSH